MRLYQNTDEQQLAAQIAQLEQFVKSRADKAAIQRLGNLKLGHPDLHLKVLALCAQALSSGAKQITDDWLKALLARLAREKESKIIRK